MQKCCLYIYIYIFEQHFCIDTYLLENYRHLWLTSSIRIPVSVLCFAADIS